MSAITTIASAAQYASWAETVGLEKTPTGLAAALAYATSELQDYCGREFLPSPATSGQTEARAYVGDGGRTLYIADALTIAGVTSGGTEVPTSHYTALDTPFTRLVLRRPYCWTEGAEIVVTGRFGYAEQASLPAALVEACCMLTAGRLLSGDSWTDGKVKRTSVINVTLEYAEGFSALERRREALALAASYRRWV